MRLLIDTTHVRFTMGLEAKPKNDHNGVQRTEPNATTTSSSRRSRPDAQRRRRTGHQAYRPRGPVNTCSAAVSQCKTGVYGTLQSPAGYRTRAGPSS